MLRNHQAAGATRFVLALTACLLALILAAGWMIHRSVEHTKSAAIDIADRVMEAIHVRPRIVVNRRTVIEQQTGVLQLITIEKTLTERQRIDDSWLQSTKTLEVEGDFVIRAGFDLTKPFVIDMDRSTGALRVTLPPAKILGTELRAVRFLRDEDGFWNKLTANDRESAIRDLRLNVDSNARKSDLCEQARASAEKRLAGLLTTGGRSVTFTPQAPQ